MTKAKGVLSMTLNPVQLAVCVRKMKKWLLGGSAGRRQLFYIVVSFGPQLTLRTEIGPMTFKSVVMELDRHRLIRKARVCDRLYLLYKDELVALLEENGMRLKETKSFVYIEVT